MAIVVPCGVAGDLGVGQRAGTSDVQGTVAAQLPSGVGAAGTGGDNAGLTLSVLDAVVDGESLGIAVCADAENHIGAATEGGACHIRNAVGEIDARESGAVSERVAVDGLDAVGQGQLGESGAAAKCGAADGGQTAVFGEVHSFERGAAEEREVGQIGDTGADVHDADHAAVAVPCGVAGDLGVCQRAGTGDVQGAVAAQLPSGVGAAETGGDNASLTLNILDAVVDGEVRCFLRNIHLNRSNRHSKNRHSRVRQLCRFLL